MSEIVHIASQAVQVGSHLRQRCVWCGEELIDQDLNYVAFQTPLEGEPVRGYPTWPVGALIGRDGGATYVVDHNDGDDLPPSACAAPSSLPTEWSETP